MVNEQWPESLHWISDVLPSDQLKVLSASIAQPLDVSIRLNPLKPYADKYPQALIDRYEWDLEPIPFCPTGYWVRTGGEEASRSIEHRLGYFYIQEAASMLPVELFDFDRDQKLTILDMAASPGGKTTHLVSRIMDKGLVIANDASRSRIPALQSVLQNWGAVNQAVTQFNGELLGTLMPESFDAVLLDAPCSMQGLQAAPSHKNRPITSKEIDQLANRQYQLLSSAIMAAKTGGQIVYSTCTLTPQENELVIARVLDDFKGKIEIQDVSNRLPVPAPALIEFCGDHMPKELSRALRIWPHLMGTAGFFSAKIIKRESIQTESPFYKQASQKSIRYSRINTKADETIHRLFLEQYGLDLGFIMDAFDLDLMEIFNEINLVPRPLLTDFQTLPWISAGIPLGKMLPNGWQPSHVFALRFGDLFKQGIIHLADEYLEGWMRGSDIRGFQDAQEKIGSVLLIKDTAGRILGLGKLLRDRLRNLIPTRLF